MDNKILRPIKCKYCKRRTELTERTGGWTVDCYYSHPIHCAEDGESWCDAWEREDLGLFDTPNDAITNWNKFNE